jgi:hypothetical protein
MPTPLIWLPRIPKAIHLERLQIQRAARNGRWHEGLHRRHGACTSSNRAPANSFSPAAQHRSRTSEGAGLWHAKQRVSPGCGFNLRGTAVRNLRRARLTGSVIIKITEHLTRGVFDRYNITDQSDTLEAGRLAEEFLSRAHDQNRPDPT